MREIEFRAWDKYRKIMYYNVERCYDTLGWYGGDCDSGANCFGEILTRKLFNDDGDDLDECLYEVTQYTGLKDRTGREIFEGDIVKWTLPAGTVNPDVSFFAGLMLGGNRITKDTTTISKVVYEDGCFCLFGIGKDDGWETVLCGSIRRNEFGEVIGNIFENPELVEKERQGDD